MIHYNMTNGILFTDMFGDLQIINNDIKMEYNKYKIILHTIAEHLKTNLGDYYFYPELGTNLQQYKGLAISLELLAEIEMQVYKELYKLDIVPREAIEVIVVQNGTNSVHIRIVLFQEDDLTIKLDIDPTLGVSVGY